MKSHFPIFDRRKNLVYLDNAATTQKPQEVIDRIVEYYERENSNVHRGIYALSECATDEFERARETVAYFINAKSKEIVFSGGATDSINMVAYSWIWLNVKKGDTIVSTQMEHHSNFIPWQQACKYKDGVNFEIVKVGDDYRLDLSDLEEKLKEFKPKLLALTHASNLLGTINPVKKIIEIKNKISPNTRVLVDGAQAVGHFPVDVQDLGCDFYAFSGHKMYGPMGIGVLWAKEEMLRNEMSPFRYGGGMIRDVEEKDGIWADIPEKMEGGTPNVVGASGLGEACKFILRIGWDNILEHERDLTAYTIEQLNGLEKVKIMGPNNLEDRLGVISFIIPGIHPHDISEIVDKEKVAIRAGHHCAQMLTKKVLKVPATARISLAMYNDKSDIDKLIVGLKKAMDLFKI